MKITDIKFRKLFNEGSMRAVVSVTFDDELAVHDMKIISSRDRLFLVMPSRRGGDGEYRDICHPINSVFREELESEILSAYHEELEKNEGGKSE